MSSRLRNRRVRRLVDSAKGSFARKGYYATSVSQLVAEAGIARATFYQYFDNKLHVFQSILDGFLGELSDCIRPVVLDPAMPHPIEQVQSNLARVLNLVLSEAELTQILLTHAGTSDPAVRKRLDEFYFEISETIGRSLTFGMTIGLVRPCDTQLIADSIIGAVKEVALQLISSRGSRRPVEELAQELLGFALNGILDTSAALPMAAPGRVGAPASD